MALKSKTKLFEYLSKKYNRPVELDAAGVGDETYGRQSMIYITWENFGTTKEEGERGLKEAGFTVHKYDPDYASEVQVSYFKGSHWDE